MAALLPENLEEHTLASMARGEYAYTLPWGMWVDQERRCWLHPNYPAKPRPHGTVEMPVRRLDDGSYEVDVRKLHRQWSPTSNPGLVGEHGEWLSVSNLLT